MNRFYRELGSAANRGSTHRSVEVDRVVAQCRVAFSQLIGAPNSGHVVFCFNGTDALNLAIRGFIRENDHVVTTAVEHNSVLRPLNALKKLIGIKLDIADCDQNGRVNVGQLRNFVTASTRLVCVSHVSNVTGAIQPVAEIGDFCKPMGVPLLVDAAQSVGHLPVDISEMGCDFLATSGHKGLLGPLGTGVLYFSDSVADDLQPLRYGGTGSQSESLEQPMELPSRLESGNLNVGGIFGLLAGIEHVMSLGLESIHAHERDLIDALIESLSENDAVTVYATGVGENQSGVLSMNVQGQDCQQIAAMLDSAFDILVRAGLHCSPLVHRAIGSELHGGTVRISPGIFNSIADVQNVVQAINEISRHRV